MAKRTFLTVYDNGRGGAWCLISARSKDEVVAKYPELEIVDSPPRWIAEDDKADVHMPRFDVDDEPKGFLASIVARRAKGKA